MKLPVRMEFRLTAELEGFRQIEKFVVVRFS